MGMYGLKQPILLLFVLLVASRTIKRGFAFTLTPQTRPITIRRSALTLQLQLTSEATEQQIESMVMTLSKEPSDDIRRDTLKKELTEHLDLGNLAMAERIDACIVATGARMQKEASGDDKEQQQPQLWALIDMMVQTKTMLNRFRKKDKEAKE